MKVYVDVYLAKNLGDDLFVDILAKKFPKIDFVVNYYGAEYDAFFNRYDNLNKSYYPFIYRILNKLKIYDYINDTKRISDNYDAYIFLGGSIFREESDYWESLYYHRLKIVEEFEKKEKPVFILGANFGPYITQDFFDKYFFLFSKCHDICFRDSYSKELFKNLDNVRYEADIIFQFDIEKNVENSNIIGYSLIEPKHKYDLKKYRNSYMNTIVQSVNRNINAGKQCVFFSFCKKEGDTNICKEIYGKLSKLNQTKVQIVEYDGDIQNFISHFNKCEMIIACRFHANILGILAGIRVIPFVYSQKTVNVLKDVNFNDLIFSIKNDILLDVNEDSKFKIQVQDIDKIQESSRRQFKMLEEFFDKRMCIK